MPAGASESLSGRSQARPAPGGPPAAGGDNRTGTVNAVLPLRPTPPPWWTVPVLNLQTAFWMVAFVVTGAWHWRSNKERPEFPWASYLEQFGIEYTAPEEGQ